jgi:uncharacterized protein with HEPN domain
MPLEVQKYLYDIERAGSRLQMYIAGKSREQYMADGLLQAGVERLFEIIGEATAQLARTDLAVAERIPEFRRLIAFRNILIHGYADVDLELVWDLTQTRLPELLRAVRPLLPPAKAP